MPSFTREIGAVENIHGALPSIRFAPILDLVGVGVNRIGKIQTFRSEHLLCQHDYGINPLFVMLDTLLSGRCPIDAHRVAAIRNTSPV